MNDASRPDTNRQVDSIRRRVRLVLLLDAGRRAGIDPLSTLRLHFIAYLANVLSPVWDMPGLPSRSLNEDGSVLKQRNGPFYPDLQSDLDRLVGMGVAVVHNLRYAMLENGRYRLEGDYGINVTLATPILSYLHSLPNEADTVRHIRELVLALSSLSDVQIDRAASHDATYGDPNIGVDNVIDFGEWGSTNFSAAAAKRAGQLVESGAYVGPSESVHLYIRHLRRRLQGER